MTTGKQKKPKLQYVDRPELCETFADSLESTFFDGATLRLEFVVNRWDETNPPGAPTGQRYPACRLVLSQQAVIELYDKLQRLFAAMEEKGLIQRGGPPEPPSAA